MKTLHFDGFYVNVIENRDEEYSCTGLPPKKVKNMCKQLNKTKPILDAKYIETAIINDTGAKFIKMT